MERWQEKILNLFQATKTVERLTPPVREGQIPPPDPTVMNLIQARAMLADAMAQMQAAMGSERQERSHKQAFTPVPTRPQPRPTTQPVPTPSLAPARVTPGQGSLPVPQTPLPRHLFLPGREQSGQAEPYRPMMGRPRVETPVPTPQQPLPPQMAPFVPEAVPVVRPPVPHPQQPEQRYASLQQRGYGSIPITPAAATPMSQARRNMLPSLTPPGPRVHPAFLDMPEMPEPGTPGSVVAGAGEYHRRARRRIRGTGPEDDISGIPVPLGFPGMGGGSMGLGGGLGGDSGKLLSAVEKLTKAIEDLTSETKAGKGGKKWDAIDSERNVKPFRESR